MAVYTKKGDQGKTNLFLSAKPISKKSLRIKAIGTVDELNSFLGLAISGLDSKQEINFLKAIQKDLLLIGSILAGARLHFSSLRTKRLEKEIDRIEKGLPKLTHFLVLGGCQAGATFHLTRSVARRAECELVALNKLGLVKPQILIFINRLSDYLFAFARKVNLERGVEEEVWQSKK
jgi:cob(I)alamin adenosyltransferase